ncbi:hypothetical protein APICC_09267 [Apis cerana cerana]|uniref:Uncharacterized protein n=1 Tax=Apis cerana cerana TaxID=94128 RepID=A0A2A3ESG4_APICC|nr:hypothetical protein APICC_09267 [Apis cerana cerana]
MNFEVFNKVKSRSAHMKSHRPVPSPDSTGQESKRPVQQQSKTQQSQQSIQQQRQQQQQQPQQQQQQQQQQQASNVSSQAQDFNQQQLPPSNGDTGAQNPAHLWHNPTRRLTSKYVRKYAGDECCNVMACVTDSEEDMNAKDLKKLPFNILGDSSLKNKFSLRCKTVDMNSDYRLESQLLTSVNR